MTLTLWQRRKTKRAVGQNRRRRRISRALRIRFILHVFSISLFATSKRNMRINQGINSLLRLYVLMAVETRAFLAVSRDFPTTDVASDS
jgi:hypothetical protein